MGKGRRFPGVEHSLGAQSVFLWIRSVHTRSPRYPHPFEDILHHTDFLFRVWKKNVCVL